MCKILRDFCIQIDKTLGHNWADITVIDKKSKECPLIDPACPFDSCIERKEEEKGTDYTDLKYKIAKIWKMRKIEFIPVVIRALRIVTKHFEKWMEKLDLNLTIEALRSLVYLERPEQYGKRWIWNEKKIKLQYLRQLVWCPRYCVIFITK